MLRRPRETVLHVFAVLAPLYAIYLPLLHDEPRTEPARRLWRSLAAGALIHLLALFVLTR